jgi:hypothetical protein
MQWRAPPARTSTRCATTCGDARREQFARRLAGQPDAGDSRLLARYSVLAFAWSVVAGVRRGDDAALPDDGRGHGTRRLAGLSDTGGRSLDRPVLLSSRGGRRRSKPKRPAIGGHR